MSRSFLKGVRDAAVLAPAFVAFGAAYGVLATDVGFPPWMAVVSSVIILSGAAQFALVGLIGSGPGAVIVAATGLALRHVPMSIRLRRTVPRAGPGRRLALAYVLVDETFGLTLNAAARGEPDPARYKSGADVMLVVTWVLGTAAGALVGAGIDPVEWGLDALFPLMFLGLAAPLVRSRRDLGLAALAMVAGLVAVVVLPEAWRVTAAAIAAATLASWIPADG